MSFSFGSNKNRSYLFDFTALLPVMAFWLLGSAVALSNGFYDLTSIFVLFTALLTWTIYICWSAARTKHTNTRRAGSSLLMSKPVIRCFIVLIFLQFLVIFQWLQIMARNEYSMRVFAACILGAGLFGVLWSLRSPLGWWLQLVSFVAMNLFMLVNLQNLRIDILVFQRDSATALLQGHNPYELTFPNISEQGDASREYGAGLSVNRRLQFGYVYLPLTLAAVVPGHLLGDFRFSYIAAVVVSVLLLFGWRAKGRKALLGALFLWSPVTALIFRGYTEYFVAATLCLIFYCAHRHARWLPLACGIFLASKQYTILCLPLLWFLVPLWTQSRLSSTGESSLPILDCASEQAFLRRQYVQFCFQSLGIAAILTLPMALWNWKAFYFSVLKLQFLQPFRDDSLSFLALASHLGWGQLPTGIPFSLFAVATIAALTSLPRRASSFFLSVSWTFLLFFAFNKQALANYYFFVLAAMMCTIASRNAENIATDETKLQNLA